MKSIILASFLLTNVPPQVPLVMEPQVPYQCRIDDTLHIVDGEMNVMTDEALFEMLVVGCKDRFGQASCPIIVESKTGIDHTSVTCGARPNTAKAE